MGSSGAGKTTMLNTIARNQVHNFDITGSVLVDGKNYGADISNISSYVQQDDYFYGQMTAKEHLIFFAKMYRSGLFLGLVCRAIIYAVAKMN